MSLPTDAKARKDIPLYRGLVQYFKDALIAVAKLSMIGNEQHNPGEELHWARSKSTDQRDCELRHLFEADSVDDDLIPHVVKKAWRALADCQEYLEENPWETSVEECIKAVHRQDSRTPLYDKFRDGRLEVLKQGLKPNVVYIHPWTYCELRNEVAPHMWYWGCDPADRLEGVQIYQNDQIAQGEFYFATGRINHG